MPEWMKSFLNFLQIAGVDGIVVEALGVGNVPPPAFEGIKYAVEKGYSCCAYYLDVLPEKQITFTAIRVQEDIYIISE